MLKVSFSFCTASLSQTNSISHRREQVLQGSFKGYVWGEPSSKVKFPRFRPSPYPSTDHLAMGDTISLGMTCYIVLYCWSPPNFYPLYNYLSISLTSDQLLALLWQSCYWCPSLQLYNRKGMRCNMFQISERCMVFNISYSYVGAFTNFNANAQERKILFKSLLCPCKERQHNTQYQLLLVGHRPKNQQFSI